MKNYTAYLGLPAQLRVQVGLDKTVAVEEVVVFLDHEVGVEQVAVCLIQRLSLALLLNFFEDIDWLN